MESDILSLVRSILELGWPAIVLLMLWYLWGAYKQRTDQYINDLRELAGIKVQLIRPAENEAAKPEVRMRPGASRPAY